jgi:hypothetical protein
VTVLDDGTIPDRRGSLTVDDEGTPRQERADRGRHPRGLHAGPAERAPDGRGAHRQRAARKLRPCPDAAHDQHLHAGRRREPRARSWPLKDGIYAVGFGGGQVDITNGKFVFSCTEAYRVKNGKVGRAGEGRHADRRRGHRAAEDPGHRQRHGARPRHGQLRQERPMGAGGRGPAHAADRRADGGRASTCQAANCSAVPPANRATSASLLRSPASDNTRRSARKSGFV